MDFRVPDKTLDAPLGINEQHFFFFFFETGEPDQIDDETGEASSKWQESSNAAGFGPKGGGIGFCSRCVHPEGYHMS